MVLGILVPVLGLLYLTITLKHGFKLVSGDATGSFTSKKGFFQLKKREQVVRIIASDKKESIIFGKGDIKSLELIAAADNYVKYRICLKSGVIVFLTFRSGIEFCIFTVAESRYLKWFENWFGDLIVGG